MNFCIEFLQTLERVFHVISKPLEDGLKNLVAPHFFKPLLGVWKSDGRLPCV